MIKYMEVDHKDVEEMIKLHTPLVHHIVNKHFPWVHNTSHYDDAIQEGMIGLLRCIELFDEDKGIKFSTYAFTSIQRSISKGLESINTPAKVPRNSFIIYRDYMDLIDEGLSIEEIAKDFGMRVSTLRGIVNTYNYCSVDTELYNNDGDSTNLLDSIPAPEEEDEWSDIAFAIYTLLKLMPPRDLHIFNLRLEGKTQSEIAELLGLNQVLVSRRIQKYEERFINPFKGYLLGNIGYGKLLLMLYKFNKDVAHHLKSYVDYALELCERGYPFAPKIGEVLDKVNLRAMQDDLMFKRTVLRGLPSLINEIDKHCSYQGVETLVDEMTEVGCSFSWVNVLAECQYVDNDYKLF